MVTSVDGIPAWYFAGIILMGLAYGALILYVLYAPDRDENDE